MSHYFYIIYSKKIDRYYIGETSNLSQRLIQHNSGYFKSSYTSQTNDWEIFISEKLPTRTEALKLEKFVKKMKSKKFIEKLKLDPEVRISILKRLRNKG